jgi:serine/threonine-protein phosphatase with EF-hand domain
LNFFCNQKNDENIAEHLYRHKDILECLFRAIDKDHSGQISKEEFRDCCKLIESNDPNSPFTDKSIEDMADTMDMNKDGFINLNEFLEAFRLASSFSSDPVYQV